MAYLCSNCATEEQPAFGFLTKRNRASGVMTQCRYTKCRGSSISVRPTLLRYLREKGASSRAFTRLTRLSFGIVTCFTNVSARFDIFAPRANCPSSEKRARRRGEITRKGSIREGSQAPCPRSEDGTKEANGIRETFALPLPRARRRTGFEKVRKRRRPLPTGAHFSLQISSSGTVAGPETTPSGVMIRAGSICPCRPSPSGPGLECYPPSAG